ncbi:MAG: metalloregulator ArsR/SmtB family transcription factor [Candidatus Omnitrophica bacterium]|nr:metalloregulator ArsR/SmtB family transcription factor [Candidatus Omnitrophota bacterium]
MKKTSRILKALSHEVRLQILFALKGKTLCVTALARRLKISQPAVSQHLRILENTGLIKRKRIGHWVHYSIDPNVFAGCLKRLTSLADTGKQKCGCRSKNEKTEKG